MNQAKEKGAAVGRQNNQRQLPNEAREEDSQPHPLGPPQSPQRAPNFPLTKRPIRTLPISPNRLQQRALAFPLTLLVTALLIAVARPVRLLALSAAYTSVRMTCQYTFPPTSSDERHTGHRQPGH